MKEGGLVCSRHCEDRPVFESQKDLFTRIGYSCTASVALAMGDILGISGGFLVDILGTSRGYLENIFGISWQYLVDILGYICMGHTA